MKTQHWFWLYFFSLVVYSVFSFSLTDPNLVLSTWAPYWNFQQWMWRTFFDHSQFLAQTYVVLMLINLGSFWGLMKSLPVATTHRQVLLKCLLLCIPLFFSYNALSHDVFNYIFNAKMVMVYHANPHVQVALDFPTDLWTRFMHNTHTPAPYGYGWTIFSLVPFAFGFGKFLPTWLIFRGINILAIPLLFVLIGRLGKRLKESVSARDMAIVFLNPLFLIEIVSNSHNDLWMLVPAVAALVIIFGAKKNILAKIFISAVLLAASISTKLATVALVPVWFFGAWKALDQRTLYLKAIPKTIKRWADFAWGVVHSNFGFIASVLMFLPLLSSRSQFFHPWYLLWSLIWFPLIRVRWWRKVLLVLVVSSLFRYVPWLWAGGFPDQVLAEQQAVTWLGGLTILGLWMLRDKYLVKS